MRTSASGSMLCFLLFACRSEGIKPEFEHRDSGVVATAPSQVEDSVTAVRELESRPQKAKLKSTLLTPPKSAVVTESGLAFEPLVSPSGGASPGPRDVVEIRFVSWDEDGTQFDASGGAGQTAKYPLSAVIPGLREALLLMRAGQKIRVWVPSELGYKDRPGYPSGRLVFELELVGVSATPPKIEPPADVQGPPETALATPSGLRYQLLKTQEKGPRPSEADFVEVHYEGWTADGRLFDSTKRRGQPTRLSLQAVIPGWAEGLSKMRVGETARLWIPEELAYDGRDGFPAGDLVFDIELISIPSRR